jgi:hypothetical protein
MGREKEYVTPPGAYFEYLRTADAQEVAQEWQLRLLANVRWGVEPAPGSYKALRAALGLAIRPDPAAAE